MQSASPAIAPWSSHFALDMSSDRHHHSRYSGTHVLSDPDPTDWDFAQEIARLKIGSKDDDVHARTPPQSKVVAAAVAHYAESSPLESASEASPSSSPDHSISPSHSRGSSGADSREPANSNNRDMRTGALKVTTASEHKERPHSFNGVLSSSDLRRLQQAGEDSPSHWSQLRELASPEQPTYPSLSGSGYGRNPPPSASAGLRPNPRTFTPGGLGYNGANSLGAQQAYDLPFSHPDPAVARIQQQHGAFRGVHQHSSSDPSSTLRDAAALALLSNPTSYSQLGMYPPAAPLPMSMYPQAYRGPDSYTSNIAAAQAMLNRLQQGQFAGPFGIMPTPAMGMETGARGVGLNAPAPSAPSSNGSGPSANNRKLGLYKTELCRSWEEKGTCRYGTKCQFAHGEGELRSVARHPKYKTEICRTFWVSGACPYGKRCCFIHTELPANGAAPGAEGAPPPSATIDSRQRANSSASDPSDAPTSLLSRISHSRHDLATPIDTNSAAHNMYNTRPPTGSLRVDTASLTNIAKQNKSAYPTLASQQNALMMNPREPAIHSPVPLTAGPDLGRSTAARLNIVGQNQRVGRTNTSNPRHSFNGADVDFEYASPTTPSAANASSSFGMGSQNDRLSASGTAPRSHVRSGSAGNWGSLTRSNLSVAFPQSELAVGSNRVSNNAQWI